MIAKLLSWLPKNLGAVIGITQSVLGFVKEVLILAIRVICPLIPGDKDEQIIQKIVSVVDTVNSALEKVKDFLLRVGL